MHTAEALSSKRLLKLWQTDIVELSFDYPWLLDAILGVSALHKATMATGHDRMLLYSQTLAYMDGAFSGIRLALEDSSYEACSPIFATACLLVIYNFGSAQIQPPADPVGSVAEWMELVKGAGLTIAQHWSRRHDLVVAPLVNASQSGIPAPTTPRTSRLARAIPEVYKLKAMLEHEALPSADASACGEAIDSLVLVYDQTAAAPANKELYTVAVMMTWPSMLSQTYLDLMVKGSPAALIILAHYVVGLEMQDNPWYTQGWANAIVNSVEQQIDLSLQMWLEWPKEQI